MELHLLEWGDPGAPAVLMVHGMRGHARWFSPVGPTLAGDYRALSLDLRGHGESDHAPPYGHEQFARDIVDCVDALGIDRMVLLGHSMGGSVAVHSATLLGDRVRALVAVDAGLEPRHRGRHRRRSRARREHTVFETREEARARFELRPRGSVATAELLDHLAVHAVRELPDGTFTWRFDPNTYTRRRGRVAPDFAKIASPVLLVYGSESDIFARSDPERLRALFPSAARVELEVVEGAHHHVFLDQPDAFNMLLLERLGELPD